MKIVKYIMVITVLAFSAASLAEECVVKPKKHIVRHVHNKKHAAKERNSRMPMVMTVIKSRPIVPVVKTVPYTSEKKQIAMVETTGFDTVMDIPLRLGGFIATVVGTSLFIGTSPITGLMTALPPHNAIMKASDFLVGRPYKYTFVRPTSGNSDYDSRSKDER